MQLALAIRRSASFPRQSVSKIRPLALLPRHLVTAIRQLANMQPRLAVVSVPYMDLATTPPLVSMPSPGRQGAILARLVSAQTTPRQALIPSPGRNTLSITRLMVRIPSQDRADITRLPPVTQPQGRLQSLAPTLETPTTTPLTDLMRLLALSTATRQAIRLWAQTQPREPSATPSTTPRSVLTRKRLVTTTPQWALMHMPMGMDSIRRSALAPLPLANTIRRSARRPMPLVLTIRRRARNQSPPVSRGGQTTGMAPSIRHPGPARWLRVTLTPPPVATLTRLAPTQRVGH